MKRTPMEYRIKELNLPPVETNIISLATGKPRPGSADRMVANKAAFSLSPCVGDANGT